MEDISRELEKEIDSYTSPARTKRKSETRLIAVDDFGKMKSADWIKKLVLFLSILSIVLSITTILFFKLYVNYKVEYTDMRENLSLAEKKVKDSVREKEYLMAKLVISNSNSERLVEETKIENIEKNVTKVIESKVSKIVKKQPVHTPKKIFSEPTEIAPKTITSEAPKANVSETPKETIIETPKVNEPKTQTTLTSEASNTVVSDSPNTMTHEVTSEPDDIRNVGIEKFIVVKDDVSGDLLVSFRVLNVASEKGDASGRVFVVLSPDEGSEVNQVVTPPVPLKNSIPTNPRRGQYFSIAHFKPVNFRIRNIPKPELFTKATVLVFGKGDALILNEEINVSIGR